MQDFKMWIKIRYPKILHPFKHRQNFARVKKKKKKRTWQQEISVWTLAEQHLFGVYTKGKACFCGGRVLLCSYSALLTLFLPYQGRRLLRRWESSRRNNTSNITMCPGASKRTECDGIEAGHSRIELCRLWKGSASWPTEQYVRNPFFSAALSKPRPDYILRSAL